NSLFPQVETPTGGSPVEGNRPPVPSGRQDLNLRPLDPQYGQRIPLTCGNRESAACGGAEQRTSRPSRQPWWDAVLHRVLDRRLAGALSRYTITIDETTPGRGNEVVLSGIPSLFFRSKE